MKYNISKELFKVVMGNEFDFWIDKVIEDYYLIISEEDSGEDLFDIHIDTFFFKCKKWALEQRYDLLSVSKECHLYTKNDDLLSDVLPKKSFKADSEQQTVFDACQWILDNK